MEEYSDFLTWITQWRDFKRPIQKKLAAAILVSAVEEYYFKRPKLRLRGKLGAILKEALEEIDEAEFAFETEEGRRPNKAELLFGLSLELERELQRELTGWNLPF